MVKNKKKRILKEEQEMVENGAIFISMAVRSFENCIR